MGDLLILKDIRRRVKVGDIVRTTEERDYHNNRLFSIGTICQVVGIDDCNHLNYCLRARSNCYFYYDLGQFEFVEEGRITGLIKEGGFYEY